MNKMPNQPNHREKVRLYSSFTTRGDPRMRRAIDFRLRNPDIPLYEALIQGGFVFHSGLNDSIESSSKDFLFDSDGISLRQRKNQLCRRLRSFKGKQAPRENMVSEPLPGRYDSKASDMKSQVSHDNAPDSSTAHESLEMTLTHGEKRKPIAQVDGGAHKQQLIDRLPHDHFTEMPPFSCAVPYIGLMQQRMHDSDVNNFLPRDSRASHRNYDCLPKICITQQLGPVSGMITSRPVGFRDPTIQQSYLSDLVTSMRARHVTQPIREDLVPPAHIAAYSSLLNKNPSNLQWGMNNETSSPGRNTTILTRTTESHSNHTQMTNHLTETRTLPIQNSTSYSSQHPRTSNFFGNHFPGLDPCYPSNFNIDQNDFDTQTRLNIAFQNYIFESTFLLKKCIISAGFDLNQTVSSNIVYQSLYESIVRFERMNLEQLLSISNLGEENSLTRHSEGESKRMNHEASV